MDVTPMAGALGGEVCGVDLTADLSTDQTQQLRDWLNTHEVLFFRNQAVDAKRLRSLASLLGPLQTHPAYATIDGVPEVTILESTAQQPTKIEAWHSDMTFREYPPMATLLKAEVTPPAGGDTMWASMTAAYAGLSSPMQAFLSDLQAVHDFSQGFKESLAEPGGRERLSEALEAYPPVRHPVIRTHPETGKPAIFVNSLFTTYIEGLAAAESQAILEFLFTHVTTAEYTVRFRWEPHSLAVWDNRSTQHKPVNDYFPAHRRMLRITVDGDRPF